MVTSSPLTKSLSNVYPGFELICSLSSVPEGNELPLFPNMVILPPADGFETSVILGSATDTGSQGVLAIAGALPKKSPAINTNKATIKHRNNFFIKFASLIYDKKIVPLPTFISETNLPK